MSISPDIRACLVLFMFFLTVSADGAEGRRYPAGERSAIVFDVPEDWREGRGSPRKNLPTPIVYSPSSGNSFLIFVSIVPYTPEVSKLTAETMRENVRSSFGSVKAQTVETEIKIEDLKGGETFGSYFSVTDRAPRPEYKYVTMGHMRVAAEILVGFTILTNDERDVIVSKALDMLKGARREDVGGASR